MHKRVPRPFSVFGVLLLLGAAALFVLTGGWARATGAPGTATARAGQSTVSLLLPEAVRAGEVAQARLVVQDAANLAGFQGTVRFDPAALRAIGAELLPDLGRGGRDMMAMGPVLRADAVALGAVTCPASPCSVPWPAHRRTPRITEGVAGVVELATIEFQVGPAGATTLRLEDVQLVDPQGEPLPAVTVESVLTVLP